MDEINNKKRICIIGGGASGITAAKACIEENLDYVIYELYHALGGLWRYKDEHVDGMGSLPYSTISNSSKEMSAFSDFPPEASYPNYMHNTKMIQYIEDYANSVGCIDKIKFCHKVLSVVKGPEFDLDGRWLVDLEDMKSGNKFQETFEGVMVCIGHYNTPSLAQFPGQEMFKGKIIHTHSYKKPMEFAGKKVVVVGIGNSGVDVAVELSMVNDKVYLSARRGAWVLQRLGTNGLPLDIVGSTRWKDWLMKRLPSSMLNSMIEKALNNQFNHSLYQIKPKHSLFQQQGLLVSDTLPSRIISGTIEMKNNIDRLTETGVIFEGDTEEVACDVLILATGYRTEFPFISQSLVPIVDDKVNLYKGMFSPNLGHSLAFIGLVEATGPLFPISEMQSRWFARTMVGHSQLPPVDKMNKDIEKTRNAQLCSGNRYCEMLDWISYMDELAKYADCKPKLNKYLLKDFVLWKRLVFGACVPYQYRLEGPHKWPGARGAILSVTGRVEAPFKTRKLTDENGKIKKEEKSKKNVKSDHFKKDISEGLGDGKTDSK